MDTSKFGKYKIIHLILRGGASLLYLLTLLFAIFAVLAPLPSVLDNFFIVEFFTNTTNDNGSQIRLRLGYRNGCISFPASSSGSSSQPGGSDTWHCAPMALPQQNSANAQGEAGGIADQLIASMGLNNDSGNRDSLVSLLLYAGEQSAISESQYPDILIACVLFGLGGFTFLVHAWFGGGKKEYNAFINPRACFRGIEVFLSITFVVAAGLMMLGEVAISLLRKQNSLSFDNTRQVSGATSPGTGAIGMATGTTLLIISMLYMGLGLGFLFLALISFGWAGRRPTSIDENAFKSHRRDWNDRRGFY